MCAAIFVSSDVAFVGLYAVLPEYQGRGLGIALWKHCMDHVAQKNAGLYAVPEQLTTYRDKACFSIEDTRRMLVFESDAPLDTSDLVQSMGNVIIVPIEKDQLADEVIQYDSTVVRYSRRELLRATFKEPDSVAFAGLDKFDRKVVGYVCLRTNNIGKAMAGPLYADNDAVAELLMCCAIRQFKPAINKGLLFMPLDSCPGGVALATKMKLELHESLPRFFTKAIPDADFAKIYCIHTPNFSPF